MNTELTNEENRKRQYLKRMLSLFAITKHEADNE